jgi:hypothetical protein|tara:strand:+ start:116 stop:424 length:309 start_codon:yes stop_codon:yes gene_type:complete
MNTNQTGDAPLGEPQALEPRLWETEGHSVLGQLAVSKRDPPSLRNGLSDEESLMIARTTLGQEGRYKVRHSGRDLSVEIIGTVVILGNEYGLVNKIEDYQES